jgi:hypothetical protein
MTTIKLGARRILRRAGGRLVARVSRRAVFLSAFVGLACAGTADPRGDNELGDQEAAHFPTWEEFQAASPMATSADGEVFYIAEGDIPLHSKAELWEYYTDMQDRWNALFGEGANAAEKEASGATDPASTGDGAVVQPKLTLNRYRNSSGVLTDDYQPFAGRFDLKYCIPDPLSVGGITADEYHRSQVVAAMATATAAWSTWLGVGFRLVSGSCTDATAHDGTVAFNVRLISTDDGCSALSFFPNFPAQYHHLSLYSGWADGTCDSYLSELTGAMTHELGHVLGFRHEMTRLPTDHGCYEEPAEDDPNPDWEPEGGVAGIRALTEFDEDSIMMYKRMPDGTFCSGDGGESVTHLDRLGGMVIYGLAPRLIVTTVGTIWPSM